MSENLTLTGRVLSGTGGLCLGGLTAGAGSGTYEFIHEAINLLDKANIDYASLSAGLVVGSLAGFGTLIVAVSTALLLYQGATGKKLI